MTTLKTFLDSDITLIALIVGFILTPLIIIGLCKLPAAKSRKVELFLQRLINVLVKFWFGYACFCCLVFILKLFEGLIEKFV